MPERFAELKASFENRNASMPAASDVSSFGFTPRMLADHYDPASES